MFTASAKKKENIAEYLLYMWQIEDIIRAYKLDLERISTEIVNAYTGLTDEQRTMLYEWYESLIDMMRSEGVAEHGHLQLNKNVIIDLTDLHLRLLKSPREPFYTAAFYKALPYIIELRAKSQGAQAGEIETCFNALYGILMLRLQHKEVSADTSKAIKDITAFITLLAEKYRLDKAGELEL
jgi:flagellin-specific chaperone FliS